MGATRFRSKPATGPGPTRARTGAGLSSGEIQQRHIRALLHSFEDNFTTIG